VQLEQYTDSSSGLLQIKHVRNGERWEELNMLGVQESNTTVLSKMFIDYKLETTYFDTLGHHLRGNLVTAKSDGTCSF
jgi:hypothetical protein